MDMIAFPVPMVDGTNAKPVNNPSEDIARQPRDMDKHRRDDDSSSSESFSDHMQREPDKTTRASEGDRDADRGQDQEVKKGVDEGASDKKDSSEAASDQDMNSIDVEGKKSQADNMMAKAMAALQANISEAGPAVGVATEEQGIVEVKTVSETVSATAALIVAADEKFTPEQTINQGPVVDRKAATEIKPFHVVGPMPVKSKIENNIKTSSDSALIVDDIQEPGDIELELGDVELPKQRETPTLKPVTVSPVQTNNIASASVILPEGELELGSKIMPQTQDFTLAAKSASISSTIGANVAVSQSSNAAATTAAAQVVAAIRSENSKSNIEVRLDPPELGRVRISFVMETGDAVKAVLTAERADTLEHLKRNSNQLSEELKHAGFDSVDIEFSQQHDSDFQEEHAMDETDIDPAFIATEQSSDVVYLSLKDNSQLDRLV